MTLLNSFRWDGRLPGLTPSITRAYVWKSLVQEAVSGKESRLQLAQYPRLEWTLTYACLRDFLTVSEAKTIMGLFNAARGQWDTFRYLDPDFNAVTGQLIGAGDGTTKAFQLVANYQAVGGQGAPEIIQSPSGPVSIYSANALVSAANYALDGSGVVTFLTAPAGGNLITWSGTFDYRVRFTADTLELTKNWNQWWESKTITFKSVIL